jgi:hypothetical protein
MKSRARWMFLGLGLGAGFLWGAVKVAEAGAENAFLPLGLIGLAAAYLCFNMGNRGSANRRHDDKDH